ncbi:hypothetical protein MTQ12_10165 [Brevibacterium sp. R8603A2]|uniref:hypothetical protein n=1 Tax=Brevibacterium sp. R8603A2 TaxID=2929779 RepID=UPI001FF9A682|nr:hypothetical protein [Brevibacterium sp. R8603A2]MCK1803407.1 hypothetical protein [Brevibacterium sp. R8603A2]
MNMKVRWPRTGRGWISFAIIMAVVIVGLWPIVALFNHAGLVLGVPALVFWSIVILFLTTGAMVVVNFIMGDRS